MAGYVFRGTPTPKPAPKPVKEPRKLAPCGTRAAYRRHHYRGETPCQPCKDAERAARYGVAISDLTPVPVKEGCGTRAGYRTHRRKSELPCEPCREAHKEYMREYRARKAA